MLVYLYERQNAKKLVDWVPVITRINKEPLFFMPRRSGSYVMSNSEKSGWVGSYFWSKTVVPIGLARRSQKRVYLGICLFRDLKQTGRQRDDDCYSHNDIPDLVQNKWIIKSPTGVRDVVLGLFYTTANQRFSRLVYNANMSRRDKWNYKFAQQKRF
jgi:hypothetical protein